MPSGRGDEELLGAGGTMNVPLSLENGGDLSGQEQELLHSDARALHPALQRPSLVASVLDGGDYHRAEHALATSLHPGLGFGGESPPRRGRQQLHHADAAAAPARECLPMGNVIGSFTLMREERGLGAGGNFYSPYHKELGMGQGLSSLPSPQLAPMHNYPGHAAGHLGNEKNSTMASPTPMGQTPYGHPRSDLGARPNPPIASQTTVLASQLEEINTKEVAQRIIAELKRYSIPQAIFAERVLCRSQGTLSDLLRNPKPWSKLKSGRETFKRMWRWLQEPEFQRMAALRLEGAVYQRPLEAGDRPSHFKVLARDQ
ncbi:hypothetical protein lerEdw1_021126 [Lerista edwardsae]|nr:hypothetical protein lerEdw1_021126 [Lerista edwardsae]